jgi:hypothetical protein
MKFVLKDSMVQRTGGRARVPAIGCSPLSSRLDGRKFVCRAGHSPRDGCATSIGSRPSANIEPRYNIALEASQPLSLVRIRPGEPTIRGKYLTSLQLISRSPNAPTLSPAPALEAALRHARIDIDTAAQ